MRSWELARTRLNPRTIATRIWGLVSDSVLAFVADEALTRGAAIAYYTIFPIAPVLVLVIAIAGWPEDGISTTVAPRLQRCVAREAPRSTRRVVAVHR